MTWVRLDEQTAQHPKMQAAGPLGLAMQVAALCYCNLYLTDGFVPRAAAATLLRFDNIDLLDDDGQATRMSWQHVADILSEAGVWERVDGGWTIHDFPDYQPTREQVLADREAARQRQSKLRKSRRDKPVSHGSVAAEPNQPRTRTSSKEEVGVQQRRSQVNDDAAAPTEDPPAKKRVPFNMATSKTGQYVRSLVANGVITEPFELDDYDIDDQLRADLKARLDG